MKELTIEEKAKPIREHNVCDFCEEKYGCVNPCSVKLIDEHVAWSEEDEYYLNSCITKIEIDIQNWEGHGKTMIDGDKDLIAWLKSLKDRVLPQPKQEWSEEDNSMLISIENILIGRGHSFHDKEINWLKSLKDRVQPKQDWSAPYITGAIEYTNTDAFIEKLEEYIYKQLNEGCIECGDIGMFIENMKKYMKG